MIKISLIVIEKIINIAIHNKKPIRIGGNWVSMTKTR